MTTYDHTRPRAAALTWRGTTTLDGGQWVQVGMRKVWRVADSERVSVPREPVKYPTIKRVDLSQLRACTSCTARLDEPCVSPTSGQRVMPHAGRLVSRRCACGEKPVSAQARQCVACSFADWSAAS